MSEHWAEHRKIVHTMVVVTAGHLHTILRFAGEIWQCVEDQNIAWHCGASSYKHPECRNANSIGIEDVRAKEERGESWGNR